MRLPGGQPPPRGLEGRGRKLRCLLGESQAVNR
jgi:hypothetical protein